MKTTITIERAGQQDAKIIAFMEHKGKSIKKVISGEYLKQITLSDFSEDIAKAKRDLRNSFTV
jgi:hypothetical protein